MSTATIDEAVRNKADAPIVAQSATATAGDQITNIEQSLRLLVNPRDVVELRSPKAPEKRGGRFLATWSGYFDDISLMAKWADQINQFHPKGVYLTLNPVDPSFLARATNRAVFKSETTTADANIVSRKWLMVDIDSIRPTNMSATNAELTSAVSVSRRIREALASSGFPQPLRVLSGNGVYLLYRIAMPNDDESTDIVKGFLHYLDDKFSTDEAKVDILTYNASRIAKIPGTHARKGDHYVHADDSSQSRPHRRSHIVQPDSDIETVPTELICKLAAQQIEALSKPSIVNLASQSAASSSPSTAKIIARCRKYISNIDPALQGQNGSSQTLYACGTVARFGLSVDDGWPLICEYNQRCVPPWPEHDLRRKLDEGHRIACEADEFGKMRLTKSPGKTIGDPEFVPIAPGTKIIAGDRDNVGEILSDRGDRCEVIFTAENGNTATKTLLKSELKTLDGMPLDSTPEAEQEFVPVSIADFVAKFPNKRRPLIQDTLRAGETMNVIGASKAGKSWLILNLGLSIAAGVKWLGRNVAKGRVLLIDNELHPEELSSRVSKVLSAMELDAVDIGDRLDILSIRGRLIDIHSLVKITTKLKEHKYQMVALDAFYRVLPEGTSENDNAQMAAIYNEIDSMAGSLDCAVVLNHHASKGDQSGKAITDIGSGAGSISRAADTHLTIRPHEVDGHAVLEGVCRSFPPVKPMSIRFNWPLWTVSDIEPRVKRPRGGNSPEKQASNLAEAQAAVLDSLSDGPLTVWPIRKATGMGPPRVNKAIESLLGKEKICCLEIRCEKTKKSSVQYSLKQ